MRPSLRSCMLALILICLQASSAWSAQILPGDTVRGVIGKFRSEVSILIGQAGVETRASMMQLYYLTDTLIGTLETAFARFMDTTFEHLDEAQRKAISDANRTLDRIRTDIGEQAVEVDSAFSQTQELINRISAFSTAPLVSRYWPPLTLGYSARNTRPVQVTILGLGLYQAKRKAVLQVDGVKYPASENIDTRIKF